MNYVINGKINLINNNITDNDMTNEDKNLLLKDLCARLPYGVKLDFYARATNQHYVSTLLGIEPDGDKPIIAKVEDGAYTLTQDHVKPYLRPMSSMTEKESQEYYELTYIEEKRYILSSLLVEITDWLNAHHFDYRGLIEKGLAIAVTKENNPYKL